MIRKTTTLLLLLLSFVLPISAQIVTTDPQFPTADQAVTVIFDATEGNQGLINYTGDVYAHTGVITSSSTSSSDWQHAPTWGDNSAKYKLESLGDNKWKLEITPSINEYYDIEDGEVVEQMAFVFRSSDTSKEGKDVGNTDILTEVYTQSVSVRIDEPTNNVMQEGGTLSIKAVASTTAQLNLYLNDEIVASKADATEITYTASMTTAGSYVIKAEATAEEVTASTTYTVAVLGASTQAPLPEGMVAGINYTSPTEVTLVLFAPNKTTVHVNGNLTYWQLLPDYQMNKDGDYHWITLDNLDADETYLYQYVIDGSLTVADPYSELILDEYDNYISDTTYPNLPSYPSETTGEVTVLQTNAASYEWQTTTFEPIDKGNLIIYELLLRDFTDSGDLVGAMEKLDYLQELGVTAIELMPCQEFSGNDSWGYNPNFYFAMDKAYGTADMYKAFIDGCHERGMAVILDVVYNQADQGMPYVAMYFDGTNPTDENPFFNVTAPHPYSVFYDFNHESPYTKAFIERNLRFLLTEYNLDGFRFDLTKGFTNTVSSESTASNYDQSRIDILTNYNNVIKEVNPDAFVILEHFCSTSEENALAQEGMMLWRNMNWAFCESASGTAADFSGLYADGSTMPLESLVGYMESHDEERVACSTGFSQSALLKQLACHAAFALTQPGAKMIWQFGEMGYDVSIETNGRTGQKPTHWEYLDDSQRFQLYETYRRLLNVRKLHPELFSSEATLTLEVGTEQWSNRYLQLQHDDKAIVVIGNLGKSYVENQCKFPHTGTWYNLMEQTTLDVTSTTAAMPQMAHEFAVYTNFSTEVVGIENRDETATTVAMHYNSKSQQLVLSEEVATITLYSLQGVEVVTASHTSLLPLGELASGCYIALVKTLTGDSYTEKIIK